MGYYICGHCKGVLVNERGELTDLVDKFNRACICGARSTQFIEPKPSGKVKSED